MTVIHSDSDSIMTDLFGRRITDVRIAVNNNCNLRCLYCHREGECSSESSFDSGELTVENIREITEMLADYGVKTIKLTGGEPLLRHDIVDIIKAIPKSIEVSMTTNGTLLSDMAADLKDAGLSRVNVSMDTLHSDRYKMITGHDFLQKVLDGLEAACLVGLTPVKINTVLLPGINDDEIDDFISFSRERKNIILQFIELMDVNGWADSLHPSLKKNPELIEKLEERFRCEAKEVVTRRMHHRRKYVLDGATVEVVHPMHNAEFCANCNRLRITSGGMLKPCLLETGNEVSLKGMHGDDLKSALSTAVLNREPYFK